MTNGPTSPKPKKRKESRSDRVNSSGITLQDIINQTVTPEPETIPKTITKHRQNQLDAALETFDDFLQPERGITVNGEVIGSFQAWKQKSLGFPEAGVLYAFLMFFCDGAAGRIDKNTRRITAMTLINFFITFAAAYHRDTGFLVTKRPRLRGFEMCEDIIKKRAIQWSRRGTSPLDVTAIRALQKAAFSRSWVKDLPSRLTVAFFISLACATALRPNSMIRGDTNEEAEAEGATYADFEIWACKDVDAGYRLHGFYSPRWAKTESSRNKCHPLPAPRILMDSAIVLLLLLAYLDRGIQRNQLERIFNGEFLNKSSRGRVALNQNCLNRVVCIGRGGSPIRTSVMSKTLSKLSIHQGMEELATSYSFRHLGAKALEGLGISMEQIRAQLGHAPNTGAVMTYLGRELKLDAMSRLLDGDGADRTHQNNLLSLTAQPHLDAPQPMTLRDKDQYHEHETVAPLLKERDEIDARIAESFKIGGEKDALKAERTRLTSAIGHAKQRLADADLKKRRDDYFQAQRVLQPAPATSSTSRKSVSLSSPLGIKDWLSELQELLSSDTAALPETGTKILECVDQYQANVVEKKRTKRSRKSLEDSPSDIDDTWTDEEEEDETEGIDTILDTLFAHEEEEQDSFD